MSVHAKSLNSIAPSAAPIISAVGAGSSSTFGWVAATCRRIPSTVLISLPSETLTDTSTRRRSSDSVQLMTSLDIRSPFGTTTSAPSNVRIMLARMPIRVTIPTRPVVSIRSPTLIGRSNIRMRPETKLLTTDWRPNPIPTPMAPNTTVNWVAVRPAAEPASRIPMRTTV